MNNKKISFIIIKKNEDAYLECLKYIQKLNVPTGYSVDYVYVKDSNNIAKSFNYAMNKTDAKYKVYINENTRIVDHNFIINILKIFSDNTIGMIGVCGAEKLNTKAVFSDSKKIISSAKIVKCDFFDKIQENSNSFYKNVQVINGIIMVTQQDIHWRDDIFDGNYFYDLSQSLEFYRNKLQVVIMQAKGVCAIYDNVNETLDNTYNIYRNKFLEEYSKDIFPLVSIMITSYNRPKMFEEALISAINQDYLNKEIVIVDNSTNLSVNEVMKKYNDIQFIRYYKNKEELKVIENFNKAINLTRSDYICFLMDDDIYAENKISSMMDYFLNYEDVSMVTSYRQPIDVAGNKIIDNKSTRKISFNNIFLSSSDLEQYISIEVNNFLGETTTPIFKKSLMDSKFGMYCGHQMDVISDFVTWINLSYKGKIVYISDTLSYFRIHSGQDQRKEDTINDGIIECLYLYVKILKKNNKNTILQAVNNNIDTKLQQVERMLDRNYYSDKFVILNEALNELLDFEFVVNNAKFNKKVLSLIDKLECKINCGNS
ncbi:MAG: glycosyltransferase [Clostridiales bacterium]|nr:glycosyltransferase [Clostridiales bacterium]